MKTPKSRVFGAILGSALALGGAAVGARSDDGIEGPRFALPAQVPVPVDNPQTPVKIELGRKLFFDPRLSKSNQISCSSCHHVQKAGDDGLPRSPGHEGKLGLRNSPTVFNSAYSSVLFWDGRAPSLEEQAKGPLIHPVEMGSANHDVVVDLISSVPAYVDEFVKVFGPGKITIDRIAQAIAAYQRTLVTPGSAYDRFLAGDRKALSPAARRGWGLVQSVGCTTCHNGPMFNGPALPPGQAIYQKFPVFPDETLELKYRFTEDRGRMEVTGRKGDAHLWRVPTWRNVALTAPYFHNGSVPTLEEAVAIMAKTQLHKTLKPDEVADIVEFLKSLSGRIPRQIPPKLPEG